MAGKKKETFTVFQAEKGTTGTFEYVSVPDSTVRRPT